MCTVEPRFNEVQRDWGKFVRYIKHFHLSKFRENSQNVCYIEVLLIINLQNRVFPDLRNYCNNFLVPSYTIATALETQE